MASIFFRLVRVLARGQFGRHRVLPPAPVVRSTGSGGKPLRDPSSGSRHAQTLSALVRAEGLEPPQLSSLEPKSSASTNSATPAYEHHIRPRCRGRRLYNMRPTLRSKKIG